MIGTRFYQNDKILVVYKVFEGKFYLKEWKNA